MKVVKVYVKYESLKLQNFYLITLEKNDQQQMHQFFPHKTMVKETAIGKKKKKKPEQSQFAWSC